MSTIIELIITFVLYFLAALAISLPLAIFYTRKMDKLISNKMSTFRESRAALDESQDEVSAQVDEIHEDMGEMSEDIDEMSESIGEIHEDTDEIGESFDEIDKSLDSISESLDRMNESMDRTIEFKRLISEYLDYKIKRIEARENFCESQFWDEKNIH